jgi:hypothetical protein
VQKLHDIYLKGDNPYTGVVENLNPLTLLETIQKIFITTIFGFITNILVKNMILKGSSTSVQTGKSTYDSLSRLSVIIKYFNHTKQEGCLIFEDQSATSNLISYAHDEVAL